MSPPFGEAAFAAGSGHLGDVLSALLDGELAGPYEDAARAHVAACAACAAELAAVGQARAWVRALPPVPVPFGFYERVLLDGRRPPVLSGATVRRRVGVAAVGVAAAAVTVLGVGGPSRTPAAPTGQFVVAHAAPASVHTDLLSKLTPVGVPVSFGR